MAAAVQATSTVPARTNTVVQVPVGARKGMGLAQTETSTVAPVQIASIRPNQKTETEVKVSSGRVVGRSEIYIYIVILEYVYILMEAIITSTLSTRTLRL
jgi:hypothetical protein